MMPRQVAAVASPSCGSVLCQAAYWTAGQKDSGSSVMPSMPTATASAVSAPSAFSIAAPPSTAATGGGCGQGGRSARRRTRPAPSSASRIASLRSSTRVNRPRTCSATSAVRPSTVWSTSSGRSA
jgi:hypothetical protein